MYSNKMQLQSATGGLVELFMTFSNFAMGMLMIVISIKSLIFVKDHLIVKPCDAFVKNIYDKTPII